MASTETLQVKIIADASSLSKELSNVSNQLKNTESDLEGLTKVGEGMQKVGKVITGIGVAVTGMMAGVVMKGAEWQASVESTQFLYNNLDKSVQKAITSGSENARTIGLTNQQYKAGATSIAAYFKNLGMTSEQSAQLSGKTMNLVADLGAVADVPFDTAMDDFKSALMGNYEAMDKYGISLSANQLAQSDYVKSLGKTWNQLSENEKMMAAYYEITRQGASAQGLASQEAGSFAMQMRLLKQSIGETVGELGAVLLPLLEPVVAKFQEVVDKIREWVQEHPKLAQGIMVAVGAIGLLMAILGPIIMLVGTIIANLTIISALFSGALAPAILAGVLAFGQFIAIAAIVGLAIAAIIQIGQYLIENWDQIKQNAIDVWNNIKDTISQVVDTIVTTVKDDWEQLKSDGQRIWNDLKGYAQTIWQAIKDHIIQPVQDAWSKAQEIWNNLKTSCQNAWNTIKGYAQSAWEAVKNNIINPIKSAWSTVTEKVSSIVKACQDAWNTAKRTAKDAWDSVKKAISDPINKARDAVKKAMDAIKRAVNVNLKPKLTLPHISVSGRLSLNQPSVPKISVAWYFKGTIFKRPTLLGEIGVGDGHNGIGSGAEAILPIDKLPEILGLDKMNESININIDNFNNNREQDINQLAEEIAFYLKRKRF